MSSGIPGVWVVWNNSGFASIRDIQHGQFGGRELATAFEIQRTGESYSPDFAMMAKRAWASRPTA